MKKLIQMLAVILVVLIISACSDSEEIENEKTTELEEIEAPLSLEEISDEIIKALDKRDMAELARYVDQEAGLLFSPYAHVTKEAVVFEKSEIASLLEETKKYDWGRYDGKGTPIELTPEEYFNEFLNMKPFKEPDKIIENEIQDRGNTINNINEQFPDAEVIEYYNNGTKEHAGIDWSSVYLVYKKDDTNQLKLIAIVRDMWTV